jgi:hypothetical protein
MKSIWVDLATTELTEKVKLTPFLFFFKDDPFNSLLHLCKQENRIGRIVGVGPYPCNVCGILIENESFISSAEIMGCYIPEVEERDRMQIEYGHPRRLWYHVLASPLASKTESPQILDKIVYSGKVTRQLYEDLNKEETYSLDTCLNGIKKKRLYARGH